MDPYLPRPQKKRGNNGRSYPKPQKDTAENRDSRNKGKTIAQRFLKSTIYNKKKSNIFEVTFNLFPHKLNEIPTIIDEIIRCCVMDGDLKRICFETGYGKPKKSIDIRKCVSHCLTNKLAYTASKSGSPKTFKFLSDFANRIIVYPQTALSYEREQQAVDEINEDPEVVAARKAKQEKKRRKLMKKHFVANKCRKSKYLKYPEKHTNKKKSKLRNDELLNDDLLKPNKNRKYFTKDGDDEDDNDDDDGSDDDNSDNQYEETEESYLRNFANLQVMIQNNKPNENKLDDLMKNNKRSWNKNKKESNIFDGVSKMSEKFDYVDPEAWRYKKKPELTFHKKHDEEEKQAILIKTNNQDWKCEFCTYLNDQNDKICQMCFNESFQSRYDGFMSTVNANNKINETMDKKSDDKGIKNAENDNKSKWICNICTFINTGNDTECAMCGSVDDQYEEYLDYVEDDEQDKFFRKEKKKKKPVEITTPEPQNYVIKEAKPNKKKSKSKSKKKQSQSSKMNKSESVDDENKLHKLSMTTVNGQISQINRRWQSQVWKAHNDKQKRIEILKRNGNNDSNHGVSKVNKNKTNGGKSNGKHNRKKKRAMPKMQKPPPLKKSMDKNDWWYYVDPWKDQVSDQPISKYQLKELFVSNYINQYCLVWNELYTDYVTISDVPRLMNFFYNGPNDNPQAIKSYKTITKTPDKSVGFKPHPHLKNEYKKIVKKNQYKIEENEQKKTNNKQKKQNQNQNHSKNKNQNKKRKNNQNKKNSKNNKNDANINHEWIEKFMNMGFDYDQALNAVKNTDGKDFNSALDYLMSNV